MEMIDVDSQLRNIPVLEPPEKYDSSTIPNDPTVHFTLNGISIFPLHYK